MMDWFCAVIFLLGVAQLTYGSDNIPALRPSHLVRRNIVARSPSAGDQRDKTASDEFFPERVLYHLRDDLRSPHSFSSGSVSYGSREPSSDTLEGYTYLTNEGDRSYQMGFGNDDSPFLFSDSSLEPNLAEEWGSNVDGNSGRTATDNNNINNNNNSNNNNDVRESFRPLLRGERVMLQKRLKVKGMGLLGSPRGQSSLVGFSKSRPKGLVLSIDLGMKALRDAIMHANAQQKNREHKMQIQKNTRLLDYIGKRRDPASSTLDRP